MDYIVHGVAEIRLSQAPAHQLPPRNLEAIVQVAVNLRSRKHPRTSADAAYTSLYLTKDMLLTRASKYLQETQKASEHRATRPAI